MWPVSEAPCIHAANGVSGIYKEYAGMQPPCDDIHSSEAYSYVNNKTVDIAFYHGSDVFVTGKDGGII